MNKIDEILIKNFGEPDNSVHDHSYEIRPLMVEGKREWWLFHNGVGSGEPLSQVLSGILQSLLPSDEEIKEMMTTNHYHYEKGHYRKVRLDRIQGAKILRSRILSAIETTKAE